MASRPTCSVYSADAGCREGRGRRRKHAPRRGAAPVDALTRGGCPLRAPHPQAGRPRSSCSRPMRAPQTGARIGRSCLAGPKAVAPSRDLPARACARSTLTQASAAPSRAPGRGPRRASLRAGVEEHPRRAPCRRPELAVESLAAAAGGGVTPPTVTTDTTCKGVEWLSPSRRSRTSRCAWIAGPCAKANQGLPFGGRIESARDEWHDR